MEAISYTSVRNNLAKTIDKVNEDHAPIIITRQNGSSAVLMSLEDFNAYEETAYLMRSPVNAARLSKAVVDVTKGKIKARKPIERD
jgi:antitoxin YefM